MKRQHIVERSVTGFIGVYHILLGLVLNGPVEGMSAMARSVLGATTLPDASCLFVARMLGTYALVVGIGLCLAARNPVKNRALLSLGAILLALRSLQRVAQMGDLEMTLGITRQTNLVTVGVLLALALILITFRLRLQRELPVQTAA